MTISSYGSASREPVYNGNRRVPNLYSRTLSNGDTVFDACYKQAGKVKRYRLRATTKTDAIRELRELQTDTSRGEYFKSPSAAVTLAELADRYLEHLEARVGHRDPHRRRSPRTVTLYRQRLNQHVCKTLGDRAADSLTVADVRRLVDVLGRKKLSPSSVTSTVNILSGLLQFGIREGVIERNPVRDLDRDDRPGAARATEPRYLDAAELNRLLSNMGDQFRPVAAVCAFAGLRVSEALGLRWRDIEFKTSTITVAGQLAPDGTLTTPKTATSAALVPLLPRLATELRAHRRRQASIDLRRVHADALVFVSRNGKPHSRRNALRAVNNASDAAGLSAEGDVREKVGCHDLRHSCISIALASGFTLPEAAALARHASPRVTAAIYAGLSDAGRAELATKLAAAFS
jgi:integrase